MRGTARDPDGVPAPRRSPGRILRWTLWSLPARLLLVVLVVDVLAAAAVVGEWVAGPPPSSGTAVLLLATLALAAVAHTEASLGVERRRRHVDASPHLDLSSVWTFAAALLLPRPLATVVVVVAYLHLYLRIWRPGGIPPHRFAFSLAAVLLAQDAAAGVIGLARDAGVDLFGSPLGLAVVVAALLVYALVNLLLVATVILLSRGDPAEAVGRRDELLLELATLATGAVAAGAMSAFGPVYVVLVLPPLVVLHRSVLVRQLEEAASTDSKTGLLNVGTWRVRAEAALSAAGDGDAAVAVLLLDLDHFKRINDGFGHLAGDQALEAVASAVRAEVRDEDLVGRFGGEEFVVLLVGAPGEDLQSSAALVADRIRRRIEGLRPRIASGDGTVELDRITISVGGATRVGDGDLDQMLEVADSALYAAKRAGRNTVRMGQGGLGGAVGDPVPGPGRT